ncbi:MAG: glycosyltransferase family 9 protein [candidate division Zixibacteria bacterium]|nr:glycosyltransferase family 9 protein [candidate division Zixibacteria bacterium]MDH3938248.1 glycosyltransferase family 9 protein [candidate division Zixibacteria bacterium]MDH4035526.1 glycosyltransferase family 9 protein [candidate division Zixibacteria bacterium]
MKALELKPGDRILVSRTDRLGDLILALPFVETLKGRYPECHIEVMSSLYASPILENNDRIDGIVRVLNKQLVSDRLYKKDLLQKIKQSSYQVVVALYPERNICQLFHKSAIPDRIGTAGRFHSVFFNHRLLHSRKSNKKHECEYNLDFLKFFREGETVTMPVVYPREKELANARRILKEAGVEGRFVVLHPGSGGSAERWPLDRFLKLYSDLETSGVQVVLSGSEKEGEVIDSRSHELGLKMRQITGDTDLRTLAAALSLADVVVANSTGPLHLAVAVGTKVVGLYPGKAVMSPARWGPLGRHDRVIVPASKECKCPPNECVCMLTITIEKVASEVAQLFDQAE